MKRDVEFAFVIGMLAGVAVVLIVAAFVMAWGRV